MVRKHLYFVKKIDYNKNEPWLTSFIFGLRGSPNHGHLIVSGASVIYLRDEEGNEIVS